MRTDLRTHWADATQVDAYFLFYTKATLWYNLALLRVRVVYTNTCVDANLSH